MDDEEDKIYNVGIIVSELSHWPHTYETILQGEDNPTRQFILRRKLNNLCKQGIIFKTSIPGTRFGKCLFYMIPKNYHILVEAGRMGSEVYYFNHFKKVDNFHLKVEKCFLLDGPNWIRKYNKVFNEGKNLLFL